MNRHLRLTLVGLFFALMLFGAGASAHLILNFLSSSSDTGWRASQQGTRLVVTRVRSDGPANALRVGDEVVDLNGQQMAGQLQYFQALGQLRVDSLYEVGVRRDGRVLRYWLRSEAFSPGIWTSALVIFLLIPAIFLPTAAAVFLLKPDDKQALLLALLFGMVITPAPYFLVVGLPWWLTGLISLSFVVATFMPPVFFHFFLVFPEASPLLRRFPRLEYWLYLPFLLLAFPYYAVLGLYWTVAPERVDVYGTPILETAIQILSLLYVAGGLLALVINYRQASQLSRRKLRVVLAGSVAGILPLILVAALMLVVDQSKMNRTALVWLVVAVNCASLLVPVSFAYAIIRHQVIPVSLIIRRGVRYLLVSRGFGLMEALVILAAVSFLLSGSRAALIDRFGSRADTVVALIVMVVAAGLVRRLNRRVMPLIDRRFFREAYDAQQILSELGQAINTVSHFNQLLELVVVKIQEALHVSKVSIFLRDERTGDYVCKISSTHQRDGISVEATDADLISPLRLPGDLRIIERLRESPQPLALDLEETQSWANFLPTASAQWSEARRNGGEMPRAAEATLLLPVATKNQLPGIVSLGPRLGDLPFSREDRQMLMAVVWQMAFAIENWNLVRRRAEEERLRREIEMATEVQRRLFPAHPPRVDALELSGLCFPARGVGGDYYDFLALPHGRTGIAVADVAGKGISAALLMSTVQALLRSHAPLAGESLTGLVAAMSRLLHEATAENSFASFFYAQFDEQARTLTYVNAGHNPPVLLRRAGAVLKARSVAQNNELHAVGSHGGSLALMTDVETEETGVCLSLLGTGGPVIGAFEDCVYEQETIEMRTGDVLVAYTDGVTEALSAFGEEFGEARLQFIVSEWAHLSADKLSRKIVESVREWCGEMPQHDDLTLVVMKVK